jgi:hypothetical protein
VELGSKQPGLGPDTPRPLTKRLEPSGERRGSSGLVRWLSVSDPWARGADSVSRSPRCESGFGPVRSEAYGSLVMHLGPTGERRGVGEPIWSLASAPSGVSLGSDGRSSGAALSGAAPREREARSCEGHALGCVSAESRVGCAAKGLIAWFVGDTWSALRGSLRGASGLRRGSRKARAGRHAGRPK